MLLDVVKALFLKEMDAGLVVSVGVDDDHAHPLLDHPTLDLFKQGFSCSAFLQIWTGSDPDKVTVLPGRVVLLHGCSEGEADHLLIQLCNNAEFTVRIKQGGDFIFVPGPVHAGRIFRREELFSEMENGSQVVNGHNANNKFFGGKYFAHMSPSAGQGTSTCMVVLKGQGLGYSSELPEDNNLSSLRFFKKNSLK